MGSSRVQMRSFDRPHAGLRANAMRPVDGRFERLQRHRENIRRIARELNVDFSSGLARGHRHSATEVTSVRPEAPLDETSRPSAPKVGPVGPGESPELGEEVFDALRHYQPRPAPAPEEPVAVAAREPSDGSGGQGNVVASSPALAGSPGDDQAPSLAAATLTHTGSSVLADALVPSGGGEASASFEAASQAEPALHCGSCGHVASSSQRFCQHCGQRLEASAEATTSAQDQGAPSRPEADQSATVDETFGSILSRWRQQFADFQRALGDAPGQETAETAPPAFDDGDPEAFVQRIKRELGIDAGPLAFEPESKPAMHPAEVEAPFSPSKVLREIQEMSASFQIFQAAEVPPAQENAPEAPEAQVPVEPIKAQKVEAQTADMATGSPKHSAEEALLSRLVALEAEVLKLREPATSRPSPELSESPRRPAENVEAHQAMSSLGMSLLSSSSLFASVSDPGQEASPEHRDEEEKQSEVVQAEPEKAPEVIKQAAPTPESRAPDPPEGEIVEASEAGTMSQKGTATALDETKPSATGTSRPSVEHLVQDVETEDVKVQGAAFFMPFAPRKDTGVQVPEVVAAMPKQKEDQVPAVVKDTVQEQVCQACQTTDREPKQPASSPSQPAFVKANTPADPTGDVAVPVQLGEAKPAEEKGLAAAAAPAGEQHYAEAGSGPLPSKTAGPPQPRSSRETARKPLSELSPQRLGDVPWQRAAGPYPSALPPRPPGQVGADTSSPSPGARWPELQRPPAFLRESFNLGGSSAGDINGVAGMPPVWQGNGGWRARDQGEEDLMLQRAYEVYRQQQLELLRS